MLTYTPMSNSHSDGSPRYPTGPARFVASVVSVRDGSDPDAWWMTNGGPVRNEAVYFDARFPGVEQRRNWRPGGAYQVVCPD